MYSRLRFWLSLYNYAAAGSIVMLSSCYSFRRWVGDLSGSGLQSESNTVRYHTAWTTDVTWELIDFSMPVILHLVSDESSNPENFGLYSACSNLMQNTSRVDKGYCHKEQKWLVKSGFQLL